MKPAIFALLAIMSMLRPDAISPFQAPQGADRFYVTCCGTFGQAWDLLLAARYLDSELNSIKGPGSRSRNYGGWHSTLRFPGASICDVDLSGVHSYFCRWDDIPGRVDEVRQFFRRLLDEVEEQIAKDPRRTDWERHRLLSGAGGGWEEVSYNEPRTGWRIVVKYEDGTNGKPGAIRAVWLKYRPIEK